MKKILLILILILNTSQLYCAEEGSCLDKNIAQEANYHLTVDPLTTIEILSSVPDCDDKFALMHKANVEIAEKCRMQIYYGDKLNPQGIPNRFEKYLIGNSEQFNPASEGRYRITANNYWVKQIKNPDHPVLAVYEWDNLKNFYDGAWEDGDGSMHSDRLIMDLKDWINKYPDHTNVPEAFQLIESMRNNYFGDGRRKEISPDPEMLTGAWVGVIRKEDDNGRLLWISGVTLKISTGDHREGRFTIRETGETWGSPVSIENDKIVMTIRYERKQFTMEHAGHENLISIKYKDKFHGRPCNTYLVLSR